MRKCLTGAGLTRMVYPVVDKQGNVKQVLILGRDITGRKQADEEIRTLNDSLSSALQSALPSWRIRHGALRTSTLHYG